MTYLAKPTIQKANLDKNSLGLSLKDYEGALSTLCAGCGHDSITAAMVQATWSLALNPANLVKLSGIGCSSKTPAYFVSGAHGFNSVHGRMPSIAAGAIAAHRGLKYLAVSGDGDTSAIGLGQFLHAIRRKLPLVYIVENNGCYGLTKGQFSATADQGSKSKSGDVNQLAAIDPAVMALTLGAGFVARSFSGDKHQLIPLIKQALTHPGFALIDVISPCVTFNNHVGSTRSYEATRKRAMKVEDFVPLSQTIESKTKGNQETITFHDDTTQIEIKKIQSPFANAEDALTALAEARKSGKVLTGLFYQDENATQFHSIWDTPQKALRELEPQDILPTRESFENLMKSMA
jgi:2-oxoglutarate ferredoxin oxidoreductase subunit beta